MAVQSSRKTQPAGTAKADNFQPDELGLSVAILPDLWARYSGTRAQLEAEGVIPNGVEWPRADEPLTWQSNGLAFRLRRARVTGSKSSRAEVDFWCLNVDVPGRDLAWAARQSLERRERALREDKRRLTLDGQIEAQAHEERIRAANRDAAFQAFKSLVPGLARPSRSRKAAPSHEA